MLNLKKKPALSLIICSRNDNYMGNPMWRLATTVNYLSEKIFAEGREKEIEIIVADWGSKVPISEVLKLSPTSAQLTYFIHIPETLAQQLQHDSPFAEVYALNAAARASNGQYIGRIDQDTLVTANFIRKFFKAFEGKEDFGFDLKHSYLFAARKQLPYSYIKTEPGLVSINQVIDRFSNWIQSEELSFCYWASAVGILLMHRDMWDEVGGYDERLIYYWYMDVDLGTRIIKKYPIVNIGKVFGYDFFHLEHMQTRINFGVLHRKRNPDWSKSFDKPNINPNGKNWGLKEADLKLEKLKIEPVAAYAANKETLKNHQLLRLLFRISLNSGKLWVYNLIRRSLYLSKKLTKQEFL